MSTCVAAGEVRAQAVAATAAAAPSLPPPACRPDPLVPGNPWIGLEGRDQPRQRGATSVLGAAAARSDQTRAGSDHTRSGAMAGWARNSHPRAARPTTRRRPCARRLEQAACCSWSPKTAAGGVPSPRGSSGACTCLQPGSRPAPAAPLVAACWRPCAQLGGGRSRDQACPALAAAAALCAALAAARRRQRASVSRLREQQSCPPLQASSMRMQHARQLLACGSHNTRPHQFG